MVRNDILDTETQQLGPYKVGERICREVLRSAPRGELPKENRGSWYCPCAEPRHESLVRYLMEEYDLERFYDLGAGDLRLSAALADDYEVVAYETNELVAKRSYTAHGEPDIELRTTDYYGHWAAMANKQALYAAIGRTNKLPGVPNQGIGIEGVDDVQIVFGEEFREVLSDNG